MRTFVTDTVGKVGETVTLKGWVNARRDHGGLIFIDVRDHTGVAQLAIRPEQAEAFKTFLAYAGRYTLNGHEVIHSVEISSIQSYVGKDLVRSVKFQGDQIILVTPPTPVKGKIQTFELIWRRVSVVS